MVKDFCNIRRNIRSNIDPLENVGNALPSWQYAHIENSPDARCPSWNAKMRTFLTSRTLWRIMTSSTLLLVCFDLFRSQSAFGRFILPEVDAQTNGTRHAHTSDGIDWSQYAYCQYVTTKDYLCNSVMMFEALDRVGARASRIMMYPEDWKLDGDDRIARLVRKARDQYSVQLSPVHIQHSGDGSTWSDSFTKLLAFNQTRFKRVLSLDSDATILKSMDELFLIPSAPVAMPRAYWLNDTFSTQMVLVEPSKSELERILNAFAERKSNEYDMEIVNNLYGKESMVIPHRKYDLITGEFRAKDHSMYLGSKEEVWDPQKVMDEASFVHFSDWPLPKPWLPHSKVEEKNLQPRCRITDQGKDCSDREIWLSLYSDFIERRKVCDMKNLSQTRKPG